MKLKPLPFPKLPHDLSEVSQPTLQALDENFDAIQANQRVMVENMEALAQALDKKGGKK